MIVGVFVKTTRRKRGDKTYEYLSLVEAVRDGDRTGHRTLLRLGEVSALQASGQLARIVAALQRHLERDDRRRAGDRVDVGALAPSGPLGGGDGGGARDVAAAAPRRPLRAGRCRTRRRAGGATRCWRWSPTG